MKLQIYFPKNGFFPILFCLHKYSPETEKAKSLKTELTAQSTRWSCARINTIFFYECIRNIRHGFTLMAHNIYIIHRKLPFKHFPLRKWLKSCPQIFRRLEAFSSFKCLGLRGQKSIYHMTLVIIENITNCFWLKFKINALLFFY